VNLPPVENGGALFFAALLTLIAILLAKRFGFFHLPPKRAPYRVTFLQTAGVFFGYLCLSFVVLPVVYVGISFLLTGEAIGGLKKLPQSWLSWMQVGSLVIIFLFLCLYLKWIKRKCAHVILWGEERAPTWRRFWKDLSLGAASWLVSYPTMLLTSLVTGIFSQWIWGKRGVEQVAVKQLKMTMENPVLFIVMIIVVVTIVPFIEELLFRGFLQSYLRRFLGGRLMSSL